MTHSEEALNLNNVSGRSIDKLHDKKYILWKKTTVLVWYQNMKKTQVMNTWPQKGIHFILVIKLPNKHFILKNDMVDRTYTQNPLLKYSQWNFIYELVHVTTCQLGEKREIHIGCVVELI